MKNKMTVIIGSLLIGSAILYARPAYAGSLRTTAAAQTQDTGYAFTYKGTEIKLNVVANETLRALGDYKKSFEQQSCAYQGMDRIYTYDGIELGTYPVNGVDYISSIYFLDHTVQTQEGIKLGSSYNDMIKAYGTGYQEEFGVYRYTKGNVELSIYTTNRKVDGIEYQIKLNK